MSTPIGQLGLNKPSTGGSITQGGNNNYNNHNDSTMFNNMMAGGAGSNNDNLVDNLLNTIESQQTMPPPGTGYESDINAYGYQHMTDGQAESPPPINPNAGGLLRPEYTRPEPGMAPGGNLAAAVHARQTDMFGNDPNGNNGGSGLADGKTYLERLFMQIKPILVVFVLVFVLSLHQTNRFIFGFIPQLLLENGQISVYGMLLKASLASVLYYIILLLI